MGEGRKDDSGKLRWGLLPWGPVADIVAVMQWAIDGKGYEPDNWQRVPEARRRYFEAAQRHLLAWWGGERQDPESGLPHLAHAGCCILFLAWSDKP